LELLSLSPFLAGRAPVLPGRYRSYYGGDCRKLPFYWGCRAFRVLVYAAEVLVLLSRFSGGWKLLVALVTLGLAHCFFDVGQILAMALSEINDFRQRRPLDQIVRENQDI
jgi:hypothetical protein